MATGNVPNVDTSIALAGKNYIADRWYCRGNDMGVFFINTEPIPFLGFKKTSGTVLSSCSTVWPTWLQTTALPFLLTSMSSNRNFCPNLYWLTSLPSLIFHTLRLRLPRENVMMWLSSVKPKASVLLGALPCNRRSIFPACKSNTWTWRKSLS